MRLFEHGRDLVADFRKVNLFFALTNWIIRFSHKLIEARRPTFDGDYITIFELFFNLEMSAIPLGECLQRCVGQLAGVQPFSERKAALSACQVERQRRLDDGSRRLEHRGRDSHAPIGRHELVALGDHFVHFGGGVVHLESSSNLPATPNFAAQSFR
jgi:hypothetical protein